MIGGKNAQGRATMRWKMELEINFGCLITQFGLRGRLDDTSKCTDYELLISGLILHITSPPLSRIDSKSLNTTPAAHFHS